MEVFVLFFQLLIGHALGDFVLQNSSMSAGKNRNNNLAEKYGEDFPQWYYWLTSHTLVHGGIVYIITGSALLALLETILHFVIDFLKSDKLISLHIDQCLHILCKVVYCLLITFAIV